VFVKRGQLCIWTCHLRYRKISVVTIKRSLYLISLSPCHYYWQQRKKNDIKNLVEVWLSFRVRVFFKGAIIQRLFHLTWLTMFETKTPVKERAKIIKWYKQTQTTKQQDGKGNKNKPNKGKKQTLKQDNKHAN